MALIFDSIVLDILAFLCLFVLALCLYVIHTLNFWKTRGIPYVKPLPFVGNFKDVVLQKCGIGHYLETVYEEHKDKPYVGIFAFHQPALVINDLDLIKSVLVKDAQVFINHKATVDAEKDPILHRTLFSLKGQTWKNMRASLSPTFSSGKMKIMFQLMDNCAKQLVHYLDNVKGSEVPIKETMARFTTDVIASCALGVDTNSLQRPDDEFRRVLSSVFRPTLCRALFTLMAFFSPSLVKVLRPKIIDDDVNTFMRDSVWNIVEYREKNGIVRKDFLDSVIEMRRKMREGDTPALVDDDFVAQAFNFLTAGFDTSSTTMAFLLYELALHPDLQQRLRSEIVDVLQRHDQQVTYDAVQEITYLDMVVSETLRKYPVLPFLDRDSVTDYKLPACSPEGSQAATLPAGTAVYIPLMAIQHDPQYYPEPYKFDPERFSDENKRSRPNFTYFPFGEGPRICIGLRFGLMQLKTGLIHILLSYEVSPCKNTSIPLVFDTKTLLLTTKDELYLTFSKLPV